MTHQQSPACSRQQRPVECLLQLPILCLRCCSDHTVMLSQLLVHQVQLSTNCQQRHPLSCTQRLQHIHSHGMHADC